MPIYEKILVVCPKDMVTGGPEALHQLVNHMVNLGLPAHIVYLPFDQIWQTPSPYLKYNAPVCKYEDKENYLIIFPEIYPMLALKVKHAQAALWWLSLENFLERRHISSIRDKLRYFKGVVKRRRPINGAKGLKKLIHFSQTQHATDYLVSCGIEPVPLIDSINEDFLTDKYLTSTEQKENTILYNPTKGKKVTDCLIKSFPQWEFVPLVGLNPEQLSEKLCSAKLYIDFGHHPGRDRMPREAAMHGCCIISGILGSAGNEVDLPIKRKYKLDSSDKSFLTNFRALASDIFDNFEENFHEFDEYRKYLKSEPIIFNEQIAAFFNKQ